MTQAHVIGKNAEYSLRNWFRKRGWSCERNPLSGASQQIEEELGRHDIRAWKDEIFLQIEMKKTMIKGKTKDGQDDDTLIIKKEWLDKINFDNDEFLVFSYNRCQQFFAFMTKEASDKILSGSKLKQTSIYTPSGGSGFGFKRIWLEEKQDTIYVSEFDGKIWHAMDLGVFVDAREKSKIPTSFTDSSERVKAINSLEELKKYKETESANWKTKDWRVYYTKLERLENGEVSYNPKFIKESQWWLSEDKKFDWDKNTIKSIMDKIQKFIDANLEEEDDDIVWANNKEIETLEKDIKKILGLDKDKDDSKGRKQNNKASN